MILFDSHYQPSHVADEHCVVLPARLESKTALLAFLRDALRLPDYFGANWDALEECLNDPILVEPHRVVLVHHDLPLEADPAGQRTYLEIVGAASRDSTRLVTVFPDSYRERLEGIFEAI